MATPRFWRVATTVIAVAVEMFQFNLSDGCVVLSGLDFAAGECTEKTLCRSVKDFNGLPDGTILRDAVRAVQAPSPGLAGIETPVVNHWIAANIGQVYSAMSSFEDEALELWGRRDVSEARRRCSAPVITARRHFARYRSVTLAYTVLYVFSEVEQWKDPVGGAEVAMRGLAALWGVDFDLCDLDRKRANDKVANCDDISTPWGFAIELVREIRDWFSRDGWNRYGDLSGSKNNLVRYSDWRSIENRYVPVNDPYTLKDKTRWQPLLEHDGNGHLFHQEHVTPHIGETAQSIFFSDEEICATDRRLEDPKYHLPRESRRAMKRAASLNDRMKARIELFDNKLLSLSPLAGQYFGRNGIPSDDFRFITSQAANIHAMREATILVWRAKVRFDLVRPNTYIRNHFSERKMKSYGGPSTRGTVKMKGYDWQPYLRVMPHAEFPSGSSCLCRAYADAMREATGSDEIVSPEGGLIINWVAGRSKVEEERPLEDQEFRFTSWSQVAEECGESRLDGGMHFLEAVPAGEILCEGVGARVAQSFQALARGDDPEFVIDFNFDASSIGEVRCSS